MIEEKNAYGTVQSTIDLLKFNGYGEDVINSVVLRLHHVYYKKPKNNDMDKDRQKGLNKLRDKFFESYGVKDIYKLILVDIKKYFELSGKWKDFKKTLPEELPKD